MDRPSGEFVEYIGKYRLDGEIGRGGFGRVYRAFDPTVGRSVAIKVLVAAGDKDLLTRFRNEANSTGKLRHNNIITVYDFGEHQGTPYLVMEYLEGEDLHRTLTSGRSLSLLDKVSVMSQVAEGLHYAHQSGLVHRDIKPANIMILKDGTVKLMDFGIARAMRDSHTRLTQHGNLIGTLSYMAPELFQGGEVNHLCDIFAYGVIYYELLTGKHPFTASEPGAVMYNITAVHPPPISSFVPECPPGLDQIVFRMIHKDKDLRYQSLEDVLFDVTPIRLQLQAEQAGSVLRQAEEMLSQGRAAEAQAVVRQVLSLDPNNRQAREMRETIQRQAQLQAVRERASQLIAAGREEHAAQQYAKAIQTFESALRLDKDNEEAGLLLVEAQTAQENATRAVELLSNARRELESQNLTDAYRSVLECFQYAPENPEATQLLETIRKAIDRREKERRLAEGIGKVEALVETQKYGEALELLEDLETGHPGAQRVKQLLASVHTAREEQIRQRQMAEGLAAADELIRKRNWQEAVAELERLARQFPAGNEIKRQLGYAQEELRAHQKAENIGSILRQARTAVDDAEFHRAIDLLKGGLRAYPDEEALGVLLRKTEDQQREIERQNALTEMVSRVEDLAGQKRFDEALAEFEKTSRNWDLTELFPLKQRVDRDKQAHERAALLASATARVELLLDRNELEKAVDAASEALEKLPGEPLVEALLQDARSRLKIRQDAQRLHAMRSEAKRLAANGEYDRAAETLRKGLIEWPGHEELIADIARIEAEQQAALRAETIDLAIAEAKQHIGRKDFEKALACLDAAAQKYPGEPVLAGLRVEAERLLLLARTDSAVAAVVDESWALVRAREFDKALQRIADAPEALSGDQRLTSLTFEITDTKHAFERERALRVALERAGQLESQGEIEAAAKALEHALQKLSGEPQLTGELERLRTLIARAAAVDAADAKAATLAAEGHFDRAIQHIKASIESLGQDPRLSARLDELIRRNREAKLISVCARIEAALGAGELADADRLASQAAASYPGEARIANLRKSIQEETAKRNRIARIGAAASESQTLLNQGKIEQAIRKLETALRDFNGEAQLSEMLASAEQALEARKRANAIAEIAGKARALLQRGKPEEAERLLERSANQYAGEKELELLQARARAEREEQTRKAAIDLAMRSAEAALAKNEFARAAKLIETALAAYPEEGRLVQLRERIGAAERLSAEIAVRPAPPQVEHMPVSVPPPPAAEVRTLNKSLIAAAGAAGLIVAGVLYMRSGTNTDTKQPTQTKTAASMIAKPRITEFYSTHASVAANEKVSLCYGVENVKSVRVQPSVAPLEPASRKCVEFLPSQTANYKLIAVGEDGTEVSQSVRVAVVENTGKPSGQLTVETRAEGADVFLDGQKFRSGAGGVLNVTLDPKTYVLRAEKDGYAAPPPRRVRVDNGVEQRIVFALTPKVASLVIEGATPGASVQVNGRTAGAIDANGGANIQMAAGSYTVHLQKQGMTAKTLSLQLAPGQKWTPPRQDVTLADLAPARTVTPPDPPKAPQDSRTVEARLWEQLQNSRDTAALEQFRRAHPGTPQAESAMRRIEQLEAESARAKREAERVAWERVDRKNAASLRTYLREYPNSSYAQEAAAEIARLEQQPDTGADKAAVQRALLRYSRAIEAKDLRELRAAHPSMDARTAQSFGNVFKEAKSISVTLRPLADPTISSQKASVRCERTTNVEHRGQSAPNRDVVTVTLTKQGNDWVIQSLQ